MIGRLLAILLSGLMVAAATPVPATSDHVERQILVMLRLAPDHFRAGAGYQGGYGEDQSGGGRRRIAARIAHRHGLTLVGDWPMPVIGIDCFIMEVAAGITVDAAAMDVSHDPGVEWAQPIAVYHTMGFSAVVPPASDPLFAAQPTTRDWRIAALHRVTTGRHARVAIIDSQVDRTHPDLEGQVDIARDFVVGRPTGAEDHGTGVAGIVAARQSNGVGMVGIAPDARLLALRACWQRTATATVCDSLSLAKAIAFAIEQHADILNLSLSGPPDRLLATLLRVAMADRHEVVAAFDANATGGGFPASLPGVIAVAAAPVAGVAGPYWAPGRDIPVTRPGGRWSLVGGSSYAAAEVSGLLALVRERRGASGIPLALVSGRMGGGEIDGCATVLGDSIACRGGHISAIPLPAD